MTMIAAYIPGTAAWRRRRAAAICQETHDRIQEIVDGEIGGSRAERILERHIEACTACNADAQILRELKQAIARVASTADPELVGRLEDLAQRLCRGHEAGHEAVPE